MRLPRTVVALAVGLALGVAGALMQGHMRNPLADPGLLGVSSGAAFAVVTGIYVFGVTSPIGYAWLALLGRRSRCGRGVLDRIDEGRARSGVVGAGRHRGQRAAAGLH